MRPTVVRFGLTYPWEGTPLPVRTSLDLIEYAGRLDYGPNSIAKFGDKTVLDRWRAAGHESMIEFVDASFLITCSRVVSHELVRHRLTSIQQESQRFTGYEEEGGDEPELLLYEPVLPDEESNVLISVSLRASLGAYRLLRQSGVSKQLARYVLPNAMRTRMVVKANLREWRHILLLRMHPSAQPEMVEVAQLMWSHLNEEFPSMFGDIPQLVEEGRAVR